MKLGTIYLDGKIVPIVQGIEGKAHNLLDVCMKLEISQINSIFCSIVVVSFQGIEFDFFRISTSNKCKRCFYNFVKDVYIPYQINANVKCMGWLLGAILYMMLCLVFIYSTTKNFAVDLLIILIK